MNYVYAVLIGAAIVAVFSAAVSRAKAWVRAEVAKLDSDVRESFKLAQEDIHATIDRVDEIEKHVQQRVVRFITNGGNA